MASGGGVRGWRASGQLLGWWDREAQEQAPAWAREEPGVMRVALGILWLLALGWPPQARASCPSQCSCSLHILGDGGKARTVVCNDPDMTLPLASVPPDTSRLRVERTAIRRVPGEAFRPLGRLEQLWLPYNALSELSALMLRGLRRLRELRLPGNRLTTFPWAALRDAPQLRLLDLQANRLSAVPPEAARFLGNLTFLDLSSNQLMRLPQELIVSWAHLKTGLFLPGHHTRLILGLQDNPWVCDCRLYDLVRLLDDWAPSLAFIETRLRCASPRSLAGVAFSQLELRKCQGPELRPGPASIRSPLGSTVLLRCGATGVPGPEMSWRRVNGNPFNGTVHREVSSDGTSWTLLGLPAVSHLDSGDYICQAKNFLGSSETVISLIVTEPQSSTDHSGSPEALRARTGDGAEAAAYNNKLVARHVPHFPEPAVLATGPSVPSTKEELALQHFQMGVPGELPDGRAGPQEARLVKSLKVVGDTYHSVSLVWKAPKARNTTAFSVLYAVFGQRNMRRVIVQPGKTSVTINGLAPKTKYVACVCVRGLVPRKEQCVIFSTDEVVDAENTQRLINVVVISVAAVIAVPLTLLVCCGALQRRCRKCRTRGSTEATGTYVNLERLGHSEDGLEELSRHSLSEGDRLLSARSSVDSQYLGARGGRRINEYFC
ncbi:leucine-rich repeat, immunoglobulin-like domain and transmembrane domain-containing protein 1 [Carlito syrichta]|uniref:leucine-rich repeat, immunoglobulin-like domain and transmembrane domain-containing protein 1 n=1 Tax=Carlito syrichta TaxID=1868482 RepID=UPI00046B50FA|nr:leucine-rich repeat, immunoglobulin-like domain and transmembrane domain-containing protein 1 [Carlito syrichta]